IIITICEALGGAVIVIGGLFMASIFVEVPVEIILTLGAIACATAPAATLMVVKQYKAHGPVVSTLLPVVALDDAVALIAFSILFSISKAMASGSNPNIMDLLVWPIVSILASLIIGTGLGFLVTLGCKFFKSRANRIIMCIACIFICVSLSMLPYKEWIGIDIQFSSLLAIMMVGAILINFRKDSDLIFERMDLITAPIFMLFFIISGAQLNITIFWSEGALSIIIIALVYVVARSIGKWGGAFVSAKATKSPKTVQKYLGFTLLPQAGVAIGLASSASSQLIATGDPLMVKYGNIILPVILAATIIYELIGPFITKIALTKAGEIEKAPKPIK
ncbi:MAG: cation:proton antiporter, partial [Eubacteriales bacterium]